MSDAPQTAPIGDWARLRSELMWAYEDEVKPKNLHLSKDIQPGIPAYYILSGRLALETEGGNAEVGPGNWVIITQNMLRRDFEPGSRIISVRFELCRPDGRSYFDTSKPRVFADADHPQLVERSRTLLQNIATATTSSGFKDLTDNWSDLGGYLLIRENFFAWMRTLIDICEIIDAGPGQFDALDKRVQLALRLLETQSLSVVLREGDIAEQVGLSVSQLNRIFNQDLGETPKQYWDRRKLSAALSLLASSMTPIKQIAFELGFKTQNYFARWFRAQTHLSPREYREKFSQGWGR